MRFPSNFFEEAGGWSWLVFVVGLALSIVNILASKGRLDWDLDDRLGAMRWCTRIFLLFAIIQAPRFAEAYSGPDLMHQFTDGRYDKLLSAGIAFAFALAFAVEAEYLRRQVKKRDRELEAQTAVPLAVHPAP